MSIPGENKNLRRTRQSLLPPKKAPFFSDKYDIFPSFRIADNLISAGYESLALEIQNHKAVIIDGYAGVFFDRFRDIIDCHLKKNGFSATWTDVNSFLKPASKISALKEPFLGGGDLLFGTRCTLNLEDFLEMDSLKNIPLLQDTDINIIIGAGASLSGWDGLLIYIDIPKNEIQYRSRAGTVKNIGSPLPSDPKEMYKCFYFVDWVVLNRYKQSIFSAIDIFVDGQRPDMPLLISGDDLRKALHDLSHSPFRTRPWFEPGPWGGTWIMNNIPGLNRDVPNYAWSFELISPENGLLIESSGLLLEVSFDCLMYQEAEAVLGDCFDRFHYNFPIRFDFLDTFDGGNLSLQCHPRPEYMRKHFGEDFTQEETYYILANKDNAVVYLGFQEDIDPEEFRVSLEDSRDKNLLFNTDKFIQALPSEKHGLFLIPYGTIHGSGKNNLVLEISTTPYIFTFKMYDWLRSDLDGKPRPLNIERGMENLYFDRKGSFVLENLISRPELIDSGTGWRLLHLPTHETHMHDIMRYHFHGQIDIMARNKCLVMNLVEGTVIDVESESGFRQSFSYAETFIVPAAAGSIKVFNKSASEAMLVYAFVK